MKEGKRFVDKYHAAGIVYCLESHFRRISKHLDDCGIPTSWKQKKLTVEQRVLCLIEFAKSRGSNSHSTIGLSVQAASNREDWEEEVKDPEEINELVSTWFLDDEEESPETIAMLEERAQSDDYIPVDEVLAMIKEIHPSEQEKQG